MSPPWEGGKRSKQWLSSSSARGRQVQATTEPIFLNDTCDIKHLAPTKVKENNKYRK